MTILRFLPLTFMMMPICGLAYYWFKYMTPKRRLKIIRRILSAITFFGTYFVLFFLGYKGYRGNAFFGAFVFLAVCTIIDCKIFGSKNYINPEEGIIDGLFYSSARMMRDIWGKD